MVGVCLLAELRGVKYKFMKKANVYGLGLIALAFFMSGIVYAVFTGQFNPSSIQSGTWTNPANVLVAGDSQFATKSISTANSPHRFGFTGQVASQMYFGVRNRMQAVNSAVTKNIFASVCGNNLDDATCLSQDKLLGSGSYQCTDLNLVITYPNSILWNTNDTGLYARDQGTNTCVSRFTADFPNPFVTINIVKSGAGSFVMEISEVTLGLEVLSEPISRVITVLSPTAFQITPSTNVNFKYTYYVNTIANPDIYAVSVKLSDVTNGTSQTLSGDIATTTGTFTYNKNVVLTSGHRYIWQPYFADSGGFTVIDGIQNSFSVVLDPFAGSGITLLSPISTTTASTSLQFSFFQFINLASLVQNKYPLSYIPQVLQLFYENATLAGASTFPSLTYQFDNYNHTATTTLQVFSTTTIVGSMPSGVLSTMRTIIGYVLYISLFFFVIWDFMSLFKPRQTI